MIMSIRLIKIHIFMLGYIVTGFLPFCKYFLLLIKKKQLDSGIIDYKRIRHILIRNMPEKEDRI